MEQNNVDRLSGMELESDVEVQQQFAQASKWAKFISVAMFIFCGLILLAAVAAGAFLSNVFRRFGNFDFGGGGGGIVIGIVVAVIAVIGAVYYFLYNFSSKMKISLASGNPEIMSSSLASLKTYFIITTIFGILSLLITLLGLFRNF